MKNFNLNLAFLLGIIFSFFIIQVSAQSDKDSIEYFLEKSSILDSTIYYNKQLVTYTQNKPEFVNHLVRACMDICEFSPEAYDVPTNEHYIKIIRETINTQNKLLKDEIKLSGHRILGDYYQTLYNFDKAIYHYLQATEIIDTSKQTISTDQLSISYTNLSDAYLMLGETNKARLLIEKTIELDIKDKGPLSEFLAIDYINLALTYKETDPHQSIDYFLKAKHQLKNIKLLDDFEFNNLYIFLAESYLDIGNTRQALLEIDTVMMLTRHQKDKSRLIYEEAIEKKAIILQSSGDYQQALQYHHMADQLFKKRNKSIVYRPDIFLNMARCYLALNQPEIAHNKIEHAFRLIDQSGPPHQSRFNKIIFPKNLFHLYVEQARIFSALYRSSKKIDYLFRAQNAYRQGLNIFEKIKHTVSDQESRQVFIKNNADFFESAIDLNFQLWEEQADSAALYEILVLSEKSKNNILYESLNKSNTSITKSLPDTILQQIKSLDIQISQTEKNLFQAKLENKQIAISKTRDQLIGYREDQKIKMQYIEDHYPQFYKLKYHISVPDVAVLQKKLLPGEGIISYYVGLNHIYVLIFDKWNFLVERIPIDFSLSKTLNMFNNSILSSTDESNTTKNALAKYHQTGFFLYQKLIEPFIRKLPERLIILPDNLLENLSFDALLTELPLPNTSYRDYPFLLKKYTISYHYSADAFCQRPVEKNYNHQLLAFAPTFEDNKSFSIPKLRDFGQLTHNLKEVDNIKKIIGNGLVLKSAQATEDNFMKLAPNYQIIHLATHGKVNTEHANYSYLAFQEIEDSLENELLYIKDIYGLQLQADLVVLSACETANGSLSKGEGIINLARGFTYAGASSVVPTLWKISDIATAKLMEKFYAELKSGQPKHIAMARAKRYFLENASHRSAHPFYWAAFVLIGDVSPILLSSKSEKILHSNFFWWGTILLFILFFFSLLKKHQTT